MHIIHAAIDIDAPVPEVWKVLTDTASYQHWNPFITSVTGTGFVPGARPTLRIVPQGKKGMTFRPRVTDASPEAGLRWTGHLGLPGLCDARHEFVLTHVPGGRTLLSQSETFTGVLVPALRSMMDPTRRAFEAMNTAVKLRAESAHHGATHAEAWGGGEPTRAVVAGSRVSLALLEGS